MKLNLTIIRLIETREPVAIYEQVNDIMELGFRIDEITDPKICEYSDVELDVPFEMVCGGQFPKFTVCENEQFDAIAAMSPGDDVTIELLKCFLDPDVLWMEMPVDFDYLASSSPNKCDFIESDQDGKDIF